MIRFEIRQQVRTVQKSWLEVISTTEIERVARCDYERFVAENPDGYFELVKVELNEDCLAFTPKFDR